jgi:hypothetical protein
VRLSEPTFRASTKTASVSRSCRSGFGFVTTARGRQAFNTAPHSYETAVELQRPARRESQAAQSKLSGAWRAGP